MRKSAVRHTWRTFGGHHRSGPGTKAERNLTISDKKQTKRDRREQDKRLLLETLEDFIWELNRKKFMRIYWFLA